MDFENLKQAMADLEEETVMEMVNQALALGDDNVTKAMAACQDGMTEVGRLFEEGEYFIGDLIYAGEIMVDTMELIGPALAKEGGGKIGRLILCTVKDDIHDIGKNIVKAMLEAAGFDVVDLGIDVAPETVVDSVKKEGIGIVALSGVLTLALDSMKATIDALKAEGIRDKVKVIVGGNPVTETAASAIGADDWAYSPQKTVNICREWASA